MAPALPASVRLVGYIPCPNVVTLQPTGGRRSDCQGTTVSRTAIGVPAPRGVTPDFDSKSTLVPASSSTDDAAPAPCALTSTPRERSRRTLSAPPAEIISNMLPPGVAAFGEGPPSSSSRSSAALNQAAPESLDQQSIVSVRYSRFSRKSGRAGGRSSGPSRCPCPVRGACT